MKIVNVIGLPGISYIQINWLTDNFLVIDDNDIIDLTVLRLCRSDSTCPTKEFVAFIVIIVYIFNYICNCYVHSVVFEIIMHTIVFTLT